MLNIDSSNTRAIFRSILRAIFLVEGSNLRKDQAARRLNIQPEQLSQILSKEGTTFSKEKNSMIISRAKFMLEDTDAPIGHIAQVVGLTTNNFATLFKKETGLTPREWRNKSRSERKVDTKRLTFQW